MQQSETWIAVDAGATPTMKILHHSCVQFYLFAVLLLMQFFKGLAGHY